MPRNNTWTNADGLVVGFGTHTADNAVPAVVSEAGPFKVVQAMVLGTAIEASASLTAASLPPQAIRIKRGSLIKRATFETVVAFTGSSSTLNIGTYKADTIATVDDADGIDATIALTAMDAVGETVICDGALVNGVVPVGATSDSDVQIVFGYGTAAFTAGKGILTVEYQEPSYIAVNA
jgi:hypothetical protein